MLNKATAAALLFVFQISAVAIVNLNYAYELIMRKLLGSIIICN